MQGEQTVGEVTSAAWSPGLEALVALVYLKRGVDVPADVTVGIVPPGGDGEREAAHAVVRELPLAKPAGGRGAVLMAAVVLALAAALCNALATIFERLGSRLLLPAPRCT